MYNEKSKSHVAPRFSFISHYLPVYTNWINGKYDWMKWCTLKKSVFIVPLYLNVLNLYIVKSTKRHFNNTNRWQFIIKPNRQFPIYPPSTQTVACISSRMLYFGKDSDGLEWNEMEHNNKSHLLWLKPDSESLLSPLSFNMSDFPSDLLPFKLRKYWPQRVLPASFFNRFSFALLENRNNRFIEKLN